MAGVLRTELDSARVQHLYHGLELLSPFTVPDQPSILYIGRLETLKGVEYLLRAMAIVVRTLPDATLVLVGEGKAERRLKDLAGELALSSQVRFAGWVPGDEVPDYLRAAQVTVIPSVCPDNLPTVAIEALAAGRPLVGSNIGGIPELIEDGITGRIVEPRDVKGLAAAVLEICTDPATAKRMSDASVRKSTSFSVDKFIGQLETTYSGLLADGHLQNRPLRRG
jgi:glycosyltransferase involved in cell wall biosynthesis